MKHENLARARLAQEAGREAPDAIEPGFWSCASATERRGSAHWKPILLALQCHILPPSFPPSLHPGVRMRKMLWVVPLVLGACVSTNAVKLNPSVVRAPVCPNAVEIFTDASRVPTEYVEVAVLNSKGESSYTSEQGMYESQRKKAAQLGANGLILAPINEPKAGTKIIGALFGTGAERKGHATAIWIPADSARVATMCDGAKNRQD
jgi:hypothetical protein